MANKYSGYNIQKSINIPAIHSIGYFNIDDEFVDKLDSHEEWELVYVEHGECNVIAAEDSFKLSQGELYFHKPFEPHMLQMVGGASANVFVITFNTSSVAMHFFEERRMAADIGTKQHIAAIIHEATNTFVLSLGRSSSASGLKFRTDKVLWAGDQTVLLRLELMLIELIRANGAFSDRPSPYLKKDVINDDLCLKVVEYMEMHLTEKLSMDELSRALSFSKSYISKRFTKVCECSIIDYFNMMKVNEAKRLISDTDKNFFEIAEMLMFSNSHYFSTLFKKHAGMTPTEYKRQCIINGVGAAAKTEKVEVEELDDELEGFGRPRESILKSERALSSENKNTKK